MPKERDPKYPKNKGRQAKDPPPKEDDENTGQEARQTANAAGVSSGQEVVERFKDSAQAVMLRDILKGNGFHATIHGQGGMSGSGARMTGGFLVTVPKSEMHEVKKYLKRLEKEAWLHNEDDDGKDAKAKAVTDPNFVPEKCAHCGSKNMEELVTPAPLRLAMTILLLGLPLLFPQPRTWICKDCEQHWP